MLEQFNSYTSEELSGKVSELSTLVASLQSEVNQLKNTLAMHQHGGTDGSVQIYNDPIRIKPGNYVQGGLISLGEGNTVTIKSGAVTTNTSYHKIDTESAAATDDLDNIDLKGAVKGQFLVLRPVSSSRTIVAKDGTGNLRLNGDFIMNSQFDTLLLLQDGNSWRELARSDNTDNRSFLVAGGEEDYTISGGSITPMSGYIEVDTEGGAASDDLDTIVGTNVQDGSLLIVRAASSSRTVVAKDGTDNLRLNGDMTLDNGNDTLTLIWTGANWLELARSGNDT
jgi:hypothetical protein